ncbi:MAG: hypothetical protein ACI8UO_004536 [Verrucomicrobiales bacterium]|jgi:hypothetical protein
MRDIRTYFNNPFNAPDISMTELLAFATDHLDRIGAQNGSGEWTARIGATSAVM